MSEMATYWATVVQLVALLALALVVEIRASIGSWTYARPWMKWTQATLHLLSLLGAAVVVSGGLRAMIPGHKPSPSMVTVVEVVVSLMIGTLITSPALTFAARLYAEPLSWLLSPSMRIRLTIWRLTRGMKKLEKLHKTEEGELIASIQAYEATRVANDHHIEVLAKSAEVGTGDVQLDSTVADALVTLKDSGERIGSSFKRRSIDIENHKEQVAKLLPKVLRARAELVLAIQDRRHGLRDSLSRLGDTPEPILRSAMEHVERRRMRRSGGAMVGGGSRKRPFPRTRARLPL